MDSQQHGEQLKRGLKNRHIQLIALGGAIGTGLFPGKRLRYSVGGARNYPGLCGCRFYCLSDYAPAGGDGG